MDKSYSIIVGSDPDGLFFAPLSYVAHARIGNHYAYCTHGYDDSNVLHYGRFNDFLALRPEDVVLARRVFIDFNAMHNNEVDARYHAMKAMEGHGITYRVDHIDDFTKSIDWFVSDKVSGERIVTTPWVHAEQLRVSTDAYKEVDNLCNKFRISVTCNQDFGEVIQWTAESPHFSDLVMRAETRSRAVIQLVLWAFYQRTPFSYMGQKEIEELLKSHAVEV